MDFLSFITLFIEPAIAGYHKSLMEDFEKSPKYADLVNKLFYSDFSFRKFIEWHREISIIDFDQLEWSEVLEPLPKFCRLADLDLIEHQFEYIKDIKTKGYQFFQREVYPSAESAAASYPRTYFLIREDFLEYFDELIFSSLPSFKKSVLPSQIEKELFEGVSIVFDKNREEMYFDSLEGYLFPDLSFKINGKTIKCNLQTDLKSLIFCRQSFMFFYDQYAIDEYNSDSSTYSRKEPIIMQVSGKNEYVVTNTQEAIDRSSKYILLVADLFLHYYTVFEKWASGFLKENYTKIISHPEFQA
ncbi:hypothetical protein [[Flexibacter] sp. ATCC 35208]|uniref:hypothetical protein n=1 Tax=[Flexibacter] sp. ATCC 35208 TaxID=1936242 RepID=UPI0009D16BCF|nr:hypothetical protein [[Flexibacter] sp. ATCC 35208]OMP74817.1 hypothetical protein BW716_33365 [[Flexibacter] sp. ATCC 35208]